MSVRPGFEKKTRRVLVGYHANCIDGFTSAWVVHSAMRAKGVAGHEITLAPLKYEADGEDVLAALNKAGARYYTHLYIVDFSLSMDKLEWLKETYTELKVTVIDHHKTAFEYYARNVEITSTSTFKGEIQGARVYLDNAVCGAQCCWNYFFPQLPTPELIKYVNDYDMWEFKFGSATRYLNKYLRGEQKSATNWSLIRARLENRELREKLIEAGKVLQERHDKEVDKYAAKYKVIQVNMFPVAIAYCPPEYASDVGNLLASQAGVAYGMTHWEDVAANLTLFSLRSIGDFDVSVIAKLQGGGGHKNAAGYSTPTTIREGEDHE